MILWHYYTFYTEHIEQKISKIYCYNERITHDFTQSYVASPDIMKMTKYSSNFTPERSLHGCVMSKNATPQHWQKWVHEYLITIWHILNFLLIQCQLLIQNYCFKCISSMRHDYIQKSSFLVSRTVLCLHSASELLSSQTKIVSDYT